MTQKKRGPGRPQLHPETKLVQYRVPVKVADYFTAVIASIKALEQDLYMPAPMILIESFRARLKMLHNRNPDIADSALRTLDRAMKSYEHVEVLDKQRKAKRKAKRKGLV